MVTPSWESFSRPGTEIKQKNIQHEKAVQVDSENIQQQPNENVDAVKPEGQKPEWGNFKTTTTYQGEPDPTAEESTIGYIARNIASNASRIGEQVAGRYGNLEKAAKDVLVGFPKSGGVLGWALSELVGPEKWERMVRGKSDKTTFPTSEELKQVSQKVTGGYTEPKTKGEKKFQEFTEDVGSTINPTRGIPTPINLAVNNLGIPAASNIVKRLVADNGFGEDKATVAKLGAWTALSLLRNVNAPQYASQLMNQGRQGIPDTLRIDIPRLQQRLQTVSQNPHLLHADPRSQLARQEIVNIQNDLANGQNSVRSLMTTYDGINAAKRNRDLFSLNRNDQAFARRSIDRVRDAVRDEIMEAGAAHPEALQNWRSGIQAWAVIHQSNAISNWIQSVAKGPYAKILTGPAAGLFGVGSLGIKANPAVAIGAAATAATGHKALQTAYRVWQDPNLRNYYWHAIGDAQAQNLPAFINNYNKLSKGLESAKPKSSAKEK